ncbi:MAG: extracellular solute-binding protein [Termitinemataceae bacterium]|nr:MAG: extracellular solute-binding protein [Termitinemataceae bacterium]
MKKILVSCLAVAVLLVCAAGVAGAQEIIRADSITLRGKPLYKSGFKHFAYVNPQAPKGGSITQHEIGTFDNFHRYALRGSCAAGYEYWHDTLMRESADDPGTLYPLIASRVEYPSDYSYIILDINPLAKDQEGQAITAEDAAFSFNMFFEKGVPQFRTIYKNVTVKALQGNRVRFDIAETDDEKPSKELMMSLAETTIFPKRFWLDKDFSQPLMTPPLGTGPYRVSDYKMGQYVILERLTNYWAADLPVNKGHFNFDTMRFDYYRDANVAFEAFKSGEYDIREENSAKNWATGYVRSAGTSSRSNAAVVYEEIPHEIAQGMASLVFNIQRPIFSDRRVRMALNYFFDFEWMNRNIFYNQYQRTRSYFQNTKYAAAGLPSPAEIAVLRQASAKAGADAIPAEVFTKEYNPPVSAGNGDIREGVREAMRLFNEAGWHLKDGSLVNAKNEQFDFELLIWDTDVERYAIPFQRNLKRYGISMRIRMVDSSQFVNRLRSRDYDMISRGTPALQYPSSSLLILWHSSYLASTYNSPGVTDPVVDALVEQIAASQEDDALLLTLGHALDRVLTWNTYCIPQWYLGKFRVAHVDKFGKPSQRPKYSLGLDTWWSK